ncbi:MAG: hypothetical protein KC442_20830 [Thermomicrobiales bacterium]|nr:hypothetical protein [Thermomicrobiales bacterium]
MRRHTLLASCGFLCALTLLTTSARAQDATPAATQKAKPTSCDVEPRALDELVALWFDDTGALVATPAAAMLVEDEATLPDGKKPDQADLAAIDETTRQWLYCIDIAAQYARGFNLMTDDLVRQFGPDTTNPDQDTPDEVRALLEAQLAGTPMPGAESAVRLPALAGPRKPRLLDDGRIGAIWSIGGDRVFLLYRNVDGAWLIDEALDLPEAAAGTPTP